MSYTFKFSTGKISIGDSEIATAAGITVSYDGNPAEYYGGDYRYPLAMELGNQSCEITVESAEFSVDETAWLDNELVDITLEAGANGGGLTGTVTNCKVVSYEVVSTQDDFVKATIVLRKVQTVT
jgi:hypothetical protein